MVNGDINQCWTDLDRFSVSLKGCSDVQITAQSLCVPPEVHIRGNLHGSDLYLLFLRVYTLIYFSLAKYMIFK